jgi:hypothetical protein
MSTESIERNGGDMPFAKTLFEAADRLRGSVESSEYKHLVLGLLFLKYVSDSFQLRRDQLEAETRTSGSGVYTDNDSEREEILEDRDEYTAENVFWVPPEARWDALLAEATQADVGVRLDRALDAVERENQSLRGVLPHVYAKAALSPEKLGELVTTIAKIGFGGDAETARDVLGRTYEYFIKTFARSEGHRGGEFYTPASVTRLLVEMLEPFKGRPAGRDPKDHDPPLIDGHRAHAHTREPRLDPSSQHPVQTQHGGVDVTLYGGDLGGGACFLADAEDQVAARGVCKGGRVSAELLLVCVGCAGQRLLELDAALLAHPGIDEVAQMALLDRFERHAGEDHGLTPIELFRSCGLRSAVSCGAAGR